MKIFLSYRFTGEDPAELTVTLGKIMTALRDRGHTVYCSIEDEAWFRGQKRTNGEIMRHAFDHLDSSDLILALVKSDEKSEGMLVEVGYALGKGKKFALAMKTGVKTTSIQDMADVLIDFDTIDNLCETLTQIDF